MLLSTEMQVTSISLYNFHRKVCALFFLEAEEMGYPVSTVKPYIILSNLCGRYKNDKQM
jgi:hypothetical protein